MNLVSLSSHVLHLLEKVWLKYKIKLKKDQTGVKDWGHLRLVAKQLHKLTNTLICLSWFYLSFCACNQKESWVKQKACRFKVTFYNRSNICLQKLRQCRNRKWLFQTEVKMLMYIFFQYISYTFYKTQTYAFMHTSKYPMHCYHINYF